jgi:hypothetical protein
VLGLLLGNGVLRQQVDEIQLPLAGHAVAIGIGLGKVVAGVEKENRNARIEFERQLGEQHIFGLKAARQARIVIAGDFARQSRAQLHRAWILLALEVL